jgi:hypothetical protein
MGYVYWDGLLPEWGLGGETTEDRMFVTLKSLSNLLDIWTEKDNGQPQWKADVPRIGQIKALS